jgi:hypothetical protein
MRKYLLIFLLGISFFGFGKTFAQENRRGLMDSLTTVDPEIRRYFPRWTICETDLQVQIKQAFRLSGFNENELNLMRIEVLAAPRTDPYEPYQILLLSCGNATMTAAEINSQLGGLTDIISGAYSFKYNMQNLDYPKRDYCYRDIPPEVPVSASQAEAIISYMEPTNVTHAFSLSLFEQTMKIGESGFWIRNFVGTDQVGYPFWSSGESKAVLKRPLYVNSSSESSRRIPYLINAYMGGGYRISSGIGESNPVLSWVTQRKLNAGPGGKLIGGLDFHMPFKPEAGISINMELPMRQLREEMVDPTAYYYYPAPDTVNFAPGSPNDGTEIRGIVPVLRATGQVTAFYHWWLDERNPENYIRVDAGVSYAEVREMALYSNTATEYFITQNDVMGLTTYKPNEFADWLFLKAEYRNQAAYPFGFSVQLSNQILLGRLYLPLLGDWLYLEGKYATPIRGIRPFENKHFFMISPVIRLTI